jgi:hypothetical protein
LPDHSSSRLFIVEDAPISEVFGQIGSRLGDSSADYASGRPIKSIRLFVVKLFALFVMSSGFPVEKLLLGRGQ